MKWHSGRGGKRDGAGRPRVHGDRVPITVRITHEAKAILDSQERSQSVVVEELILALRETK